MNQFILQYTRHEIPDIGLEKIDRLDVTALLDSFVYPIVWTFDKYLKAWLPCEITSAFAKWLDSDKINLELSTNRQTQLRRVGIIPPTERISSQQLFVTRRVDKLVKIPQLLSKDYVKWLRDFFERVNKIRWPDMYGISRTSVNDHPLMRLIHSQILMFVQDIVARPLKPSYSFTATYDNKSNLPRHTDRPQCAWNISILFGGTPQDVPLTQWPLFVEVRDKVHSLELEPGDGGLYSGIAHPHWRDVMPDKLQTVTGAFLHYVDFDFEGGLN